MAKRKRNDFTIEELEQMKLSELDKLLTHKEYAFVQALLEGNTRRRAYRIAYPDCNASDRVVDTKAYELFNRGVVRVSYERHLERMQKNKMNAAFIRGQRATRELEDIAYGEKKYTAYHMDGTEYERYPSLSQRIEALKEIRKDSSEILKTEIAAEKENEVLDNILEQLGDGK